MASDDIRVILRKFYLSLRRKIQPLEVAPEIDGLTEFDVQQITATTKNEGNLVGSDKLLDAIRRRTTRTFVSFVFVLRQSHPDVAEEIIQYARNEFPHINRSIENYHRSQKPSATIRPSQATVTATSNTGPAGNFAVEFHHTHERTELSTTSFGNSQQAIFTKEQESRDLMYTSSGITMQETYSTSGRQVAFTTETELDEVPDIVFRKWATKLSEENRWQKLADVLQLSRKQVKDLKKANNPGEDILDIMSSKEAVTVRGLMHYLESTELDDVLHLIHQHLVPSEAMVTGTNNTAIQTQTDLDNIQQPLPREASPQGQDQGDIPSQPNNIDSVNSPMKRMDISENSDESLVNNEDQTETVLIGAEGFPKTLINNLNSTNMKFDAVKTVHIHLPANGEQVNGSGDKVQNITQQNSACLNRDTSLDSTSSNTSPNTGNYRSDPLNMDITTRDHFVEGLNIQNNNLSHEQRLTTYNSSPDTFRYQSCQSETNLLLDSDNIPFPSQQATSQSLPDQDISETSSLTFNPRGLITHPHESCDRNFEKNAAQEEAALNRDVANQVNLDSFRNLQYSIPGTGSTSERRGQNQSDGMMARQYRIQSPEERNGSLRHNEKSADQQYTELNHDVTNQPRLDSYRNLHQGSNDDASTNK